MPIGFNGYSLAIGGALSTTLGGFFYDLGMKWNVSWLPWLVCFGISLLVLWSLYSLGRWKKLR